MIVRAFKSADSVLFTQGGGKNATLWWQQLSQRVTAYDTSIGSSVKKGEGGRGAY